MAAPAWLPDWRDANAYAYLEGATLRQFAWQFLRRNPEYRADYAEWLRLHELRKAGREDATPGCFVCEPPIADGESMNDYAARMHGSPYARVGLAALLPTKWGFADELLNPATHDIPGVDSWRMRARYRGSDYPEEMALGDPFDAAPRLMIPRGEGEHLINAREEWSPRHTDEVAIAFDLRLPLAPQVERARDLLRAKRKAIFDLPRARRALGCDAADIERAVARASRFIKTSPRPRSNDLVRYLRALDCVEREGRGATRLIAMAFHKRDAAKITRAERAIRSARSYRDQGWRALVIM